MHHIYFIAFVIYLIAYSYLFSLHSHLMLDNHSVGLETQDKDIVCRLLDKNEESFFDCSPRVRYKPWVSSWEKITLATTLCTWSSNEVAHCLVSSILFAGIIAREQRKAFTTTSFHEQRQFSEGRSSSSVVQSPKLGEVASLWVFSFF
jgi:hypothetical protein